MHQSTLNNQEKLSENMFLDVFVNVLKSITEIALLQKYKKA